MVDITAIRKASFSTKKLAFFGIQATQPGPRAPIKPNSELSSALLSMGSRVILSRESLSPSKGTVF
jgi:hypothetical protein